MCFLFADDSNHEAVILYGETATSVWDVTTTEKLLKTTLFFTSDIIALTFFFFTTSIFQFSKYHLYFFPTVQPWNCEKRNEKQKGFNCCFNLIFIYPLCSVSPCSVVGCPLAPNKIFKIQIRTIA